MQKRIFISLFMSIGLFIVLLIIVTSCMGCGRSLENSIDIKKKCIGVIETSDNKNCSYIGWYDYNLKYKGKSSIGVANVSGTGCRSVRKDDYVYLVTGGGKKSSSPSSVICLDMSNSKSNVSIYKSSRYINDITVDKDLYTTSCEYMGTNVSFIDKIVDKSRKKSSLSIENIVISKIYVFRNKLYAIGFGYDDYGENERVYSKLYVIDSNNMKILKELEVSDKVIDASDMLVYKDDLYIAARTKRGEDGSEIDNKELLSMNINTYKWKSRYVGDNVGQFVGTYDNNDSHYIMFTNYDMVLDEGNILYSMNLDNEHIGKEYLGDKARDVMLKDNYIYSIGEDSIRKYCYTESNNLFETSLHSKDVASSNVKILSNKVKLKKCFNNVLSNFTCLIGKR